MNTSLVNQSVLVDAPTNHKTGSPTLVEIFDKDYSISSLEDACEKWNQIRELTGTPSSRMPLIAVLDSNRNYLGHIAYNGTFCSIKEEIYCGIFRG